jgi:hypothetical protein
LVLAVVAVVAVVEEEEEEEEEVAVVTMMMVVVASAVSEVDQGEVDHRSSIQFEQHKQQRAVHSQHQSVEWWRRVHFASAFDICCDSLHKLYRNFVPTEV